MHVAIEIRHTVQAPARSNGWTQSAANKNIIVEIPDRCLERTGVSKHVVRVTIAIKITYGSPGCSQHVVTDIGRSFACVWKLERGLRVRLRLLCCPTGLQCIAGDHVLLRQIHVTGERRESQSKATGEND